MIKYTLRDREELLESIRVLGNHKKNIEKEYRIKLQDIESDIDVINAELALLKSLGVC